VPLRALDISNKQLQGEKEEAEGGSSALGTAPKTEAAGQGEGERSQEGGESGSRRTPTGHPTRSSRACHVSPAHIACMNTHVAAAAGTASLAPSASLPKEP